MIVRCSDFESIVRMLSVSGFYGLDTETFGLRDKDRLFSIILADAERGYYFNFNGQADHLGRMPDPECVLPYEWIERMAPIFENPESTFAIHNAKFDLRKLDKEGIAVLGHVHCTEVFARVEKNNRIQGYSLALCAARIGLAKDKRVDAYIKEHRLYRMEYGEKVPCFNLVPLPLTAEYGCTDAILHRKLGLHQLAAFASQEVSKPTGAPSIWPLVHNDRKLVKACFKIERRGLRINRDYSQRALTYTQQAAASAMEQFGAMTGIPYEDSGTVLAEAFAKMGIELPKTPKSGKPCTNKQVLDALENPLADKIREIRGHQKLASTYYSNFLRFSDEQGIIKPNIRIAGTETERFSYSDPNIQNLPKEDDPEDQHKEFLVRRAFVPFDSDWCLVPIDFRQQEFRLMLDYAGEHDLIAAVNGGMDVHEATAQLLGIKRGQAKTINFGLLYGMGTAKLAKALKLPFDQAAELKALYFAKLPRVKQFIRAVMKAGEDRGYVWNWYGYRCHISSPEFAYALPNHLIQGGGARVIKLAIVELDEYFLRHRLRSGILAQVHDELLFGVHRSELEHIPAFREIMEKQYQPKNGMKLECSVEHSWKSWAKWDQVKGYPDAKCA